MTRTVATAAGAYQNNIIDFSSYRKENKMESRRYILVPVEEEELEPRPRRNHHSEVGVNFIHTCLNLTAIAVTLTFAVELVGIL